MDWKRRSQLIIDQTIRIDQLTAERDKLEAKLFAAESRLYDLINERNEIENHG